ncbi:MAG: DUF2325 domain-containing protein [Clostridia bacterium]|nr:DUF2325 domain-containing protein [Clostridia bacterium]
MSVVILGGNECMIRRYVDICGEYNCKAKVYPKMSGGMRNIGSPDLLILFTNTMSHKMVNSALNGTDSSRTKIARCHSSSASALRGILDEHIG